MMKKLIVALIFIAIAAAAGYGFVKTKEASLPIPKFTLQDLGQRVVNYAQYGQFIDEGTSEFKYKITNRSALAAAVGEGLYPNSSVYKSPTYLNLQKEGKLKGDRWTFVAIDDTELSFYKWATLSDEHPGVKEFYIALALENGDQIAQAIKGYYSVMVNYPKTASFTYWNTPWYPAKRCITIIKYLTRKYPFLGMKLVGADIRVENGYDQDPANDVFYIKPGRIVKCSPRDLIEWPRNSKITGIKRSVGGKKVKLVQYNDGDWQMFVDNKPFIVKAIAYAPTKIGQSADEGTITDWTQSDAPYKAWVDKNRNNIQDPNEPEVGDFKLMKDMGANTIRIYENTFNSNKELYRDMYKKYGIMVIMGDLIGTYSVGSGASWYRGTNYSDPVHQEKLKEKVRKMVEEYKDEPYILMWMLGNETNYGVANSSKRFPQPYYAFVNDVARMIKEIDPDHPVALCNGDTFYLHYFSEACPDIDILGMNSYRGWHGFGLWTDVKNSCDKPVIITEFGAPALWDGHTDLESEEAQAEYHRGSWQDILYNSCGYGAGNALGGVVFEWVDEWWKAYEPTLHDSHKQWPGPVKGGWFYEEWLGITSQGDGSSSPYLRQLRKGYYAYQEMWNPTFRDKVKKLWYNIVVYFSI